MHRPFIMVAPNGAYKTRQDHPALPVSIDDIVQTAKACYKAGANGLHAHVRDKNGEHTLDAGLYRELLERLGSEVPELEVQITTEAVGRYRPDQQRAVVREVQPRAVSVSLREMLSDDDEQATREFYFYAAESDIDLQHILYSSEEAERLDRLVAKKIIPADNLSVLFVLGRYTHNQSSSPEDLAPFLEARQNSSFLGDGRFMVCAFGQRETECLLAAARAGGNCRIGFENNLLQSDGAIARDNAARVAELIEALATLQHP